MLIAIMYSDVLYIAIASIDKDHVVMSCSYSVDSDHVVMSCNCSYSVDSDHVHC